MPNLTLSEFDCFRTWPAAWGTSGTLVIGINQEILGDDGVAYPVTANMGGSLRSLGLHWASTITVTNGLATCGSISGLPTTDTALPSQVAGYNVYVYDAKGQMQVVLAEGNLLHSNMPSTFSWAQWVTANAFTQYQAPVQFIGDYNTVQSMIDSVILAKATDNIFGITELSTPAVSASIPISLGENDRRVTNPWSVTATAIGAVGNGTTNNRTALNTLANTTMAAFGGGEIYFPNTNGGANSDYLISSDMTFPANVSLRFDPGARLKIPTGVTVTILGQVSDTLYQTFNCVGTGAVSFVGNSRIARLTPQLWGASPSALKATNTTALQACINAAAASGIPMYVPQGTYTVGSLTIPEDPVAGVFTLRGAGMGQAYKIGAGNDLTTQHGTIFNFTNADGSDFLTYTTSVFQDPTLTLTDFQVIGPDTDSPRTTTSGDAIVITSSSNAVPFLHITNVKVAYFFGGVGFNIELAEHSTLTNVVAEFCDVGFRFARAFNGNAITGIYSRMNASKAVVVDQSESNAVNGGVIESNEKTGWYAEGMVTWAVIGVHFENNNISNTADTYALDLNSTAVVGDTGGRNLFNRFIACTFNNLKDKIRLRTTVDGSSGITFDGAYTSSVTAPKITIDSGSVGTRLIDFAAPADITDNGAETFIYWEGVAYNPPGGAAAPSLAFGTTGRGFYNDTISGGMGFAVDGAEVGGTTPTGISVLPTKVFSVASGAVDAGMSYDAGVDGAKVVGAGGVTLGLSAAGVYTEKAKVTSAGLTVGVGTAVKTLLHGTATLVGGTVVVSNAAVTANSRIMLTSQVDGGTPGFLRISARSAGVSFTILSSSGTDTSTVAWEIIEP